VYADEVFVWLGDWEGDGGEDEFGGLGVWLEEGSHCFGESGGCHVLMLRREGSLVRGMKRGAVN